MIIERRSNLKNKKLKGKKKVILTTGLIIILLIIALLASFWIYVKTSFISKNEVKNIILSEIGTDESNVFFESIDLELDKKEYEVELYYNNKDYEFKLSAKDGTIIYTDYYVHNSTNIGSSNNSSSTTTATTSSGISLDEAVSIVLEDIGASESDVDFLKKEQDYDYNELVYDIEFYYYGYEYDYEIRASDGVIISQKKELLKNGVS